MTHSGLMTGTGECAARHTMSDSRTAASMSAVARAIGLRAASFFASSNRSEHTLMCASSRINGSSRRCSLPLDARADHCGHPRAGAAHMRAERIADAAVRTPVMYVPSITHEAAPVAGSNRLIIASGSATEGQVAIEYVDDLDRHLHAGPPGGHGERESLSRDRQLRPRWRLVAELEPAETLFEAIESSGRSRYFSTSASLNVNTCQMPLRISNVASLAGRSNHQMPHR